jgi:hypothetical protein
MPDPPTGPETRAPFAPDPFDQICYVVIDGGKVIQVEVQPLPDGAYGPDDHGPLPPRPDLPPLNRLQPALEARIKASASGEVAEVIITFAENLTSLPLPSPQWYVPNPAPMDENWLSGIYQERADDYRELTDHLLKFNAEVLDSYGVIRALRVKIPLQNIRPLLDSLPQASYVELQRAGELPPTGIALGPLNTVADVADAIRDACVRVGLDRFHGEDLATGRIALLDTGVLTPDAETPLINLLSRLEDRYECAGLAGPPDAAHPCVRGATNNPDDHGTLTTAVLTAATTDPDFAGVTDMAVDVFAVYAPGADGKFELDCDAAVRAFETIIASSKYSVVVASIQGKRLAHSAISAAADRAFDAGLIVVAANGNTRFALREVVGEDEPWWTTSPANGHKVIGAGAFDLEGRSGADDQSFGIDDGRIKPDIQGPTDYIALPAPVGADPHGLSETSGATPIVGGAAALLRAGLAGLDPPSRDAGQVYAHLILAGQKVDFTADECQDGAGPLLFPSDGPHWWGKVAVSTGETVTIPLEGTAAVDRIEAACWWPEQATLIPADNPTATPIHALHNKIWLGLGTPGGTPVKSSWSTSVFQRVRLDISGGSHSATLQIIGRQVPTNPPQAVYWAAFGRPVANT